MTLNLRKLNVPDGWRLSSVGEACEIHNHLRLPISVDERKTMQGKYPYYGPTGILDYLDHYRVDGKFALIGEDGDHFLKFSDRPMTLLVKGKLNVNNHAHLIVGKKDCLTEWFYHYFRYMRIFPYLTRQGAGRYKLNKSSLKELPILLPSIPEQQMIAEMLSTWDKAIELVGKLIKTKQMMKKGLMQQLLSGKLRFQGFDSKWIEVRLKDVFSERNENDLSLELLSITGSEGVVPRDEIGRKDTSSADKSKYKVIRPGDIGYNTMRMWQGRSAVSRLCGIVSPAYTIVTPKEKQDVDFFGYLFQLPKIIHLFYRYSQGLVSDTWSLKFPHFAQIMIHVPEYDEQKRIAEAFLHLDKEIELLTRKAVALQKQKRGLMQKLLTGEVRVKVKGRKGMLRSIEKMRIPIPDDEDGMVGRECPEAKCLGYFKIKLGTGILEEGYDKCFCPYCGHASTQDHFWTKEQIEYAQSVGMREVQRVLKTEIKKWDRKLRTSTRNSFIKLRVDYKQSHYPIARYAEKELETHLVCESCTLEYAVYGKFAYCPDCGADNTLQILRGNLDLVHKLLVQAKAEDDSAFREYLVQNALEDVISSFDSFGRNSIKLFTKNTDIDDFSISFQNVTKAQETLLKEFSFDIARGLEKMDWEKIVVDFQKRHLISHNDGIIDDLYVQRTNDHSAIPGRKIVVTADEVDEMLGSIETIAQNFQADLANWKSLVNNEGD